MNDVKKLLVELKKKDKEKQEEINNVLLKNIVLAFHKEKSNKIKFLERSDSYITFDRIDKELQSFFVLNEFTDQLLGSSGKMYKQIHTGFSFYGLDSSRWEWSYAGYDMKILCENADWFEKKGLKITLSEYETTYVKSRKLKIKGWKRKYLIYKTPIFEEVQEILPITLRTITISLKR